MLHQLQEVVSSSLNPQLRSRQGPYPTSRDDEIGKDDDTAVILRCIVERGAYAWCFRDTVRGCNSVNRKAAAVRS